MPTREIISLQVGSYSNHIGAHLFNLQEKDLGSEEIDHGVLWREGKRLGKSIWNPRVLIFDLSNNWALPSNSLSQSSSTTTTSTATATIIKEPNTSRSGHNEKTLEKIQNELLWDGKVERIQRGEELELANKSTPGSNTTANATGRRNNLDLEGFENWGEYSRWKLHLPDENGYSISNFAQNPTLNALSNFGQGSQIYTSLQDQISDSIRRYAEESNYLQGFQILVDQNDGFCGLGGGILQNISDDYEKKISMCFGTSPPQIKNCPETGETSIDFKMRIANTALLWNAFNHHSSFFTSIGLSQDILRPSPIPSTIPFIKYKPNSYYESSSILASALDTLSGSYRIQKPTLDMYELTTLLNAYGHKMGQISMALPFTLLPSPEDTLFKTLQERGLSGLTSLTPGLLMDPKQSIGNFFVVRGFSSLDRIINKTDMGISQGRISNAESCLEVYSQEVYPKSVNVAKSISTPFKLSHSFPRLFEQNFLEANASRKTSTTTFLQQQQQKGGSSLSSGDQERDITWEFSTMVSAHNSLLTGGLLGRMIDVAGSGTNRMGNFFVANELEVDDYIECINELKVLQESYEMEGFRQ